MNQSILLAACDALFVGRLEEAFGSTLKAALQHVEVRNDPPDPEGTASAIADADPHVVVLGSTVPLTHALRIAEEVDARHPGIAVLLVADRTSEMLEAALRAGVRDVIPPGWGPQEVRASLERALEGAQRRRATAQSEAGASGPRARVITVLSPKGGSGKTTVATNLALGLATAGGGNVALVDLDLQFGDVATAMRLMPEHSLADAVRGGAQFDAMGLKLLLTPHPSGLYALCAPDSPAEGEEVSAEQSSLAVQLLADEFQYVIVDTSAGVSESTLAAVEISTDLILLCTFDVPSVRSLRKLVQALDALGMVQQRRHFVLNRADSRVGLLAADVEATVGMAVDVSISSSRSVPLSMNQGSPLLESDPRAAVSKQMMELTRRFVDEPTQQGGGSRLFRRSAR